MSDLSEIRAAIEGAKTSGLPVVATMTFDVNGHTMMGVSPEQAVEALQGWGAAAVGGNCGNGPGEILEVIEKKAAGQEVARPKAAAGKVTDLMEALRASIEATKKERAATAEVEKRRARRAAV